MKTDNRCAIIIPAHNEETLIAHTLISLTQFIAKEHIYVIDDASTDNTVKHAKEQVTHVTRNIKNIGKAKSIVKTIKTFNLIKKYRYIFPLDADTSVTSGFIHAACDFFDRDINKDTIAIVGRVKGRQTNWITRYRIWEYEVGQRIHKSAQDLLGAITVCSGCATMYRSEIFRKICFSSDTKTEDMDLTFSLYRKRLGNIHYLPIGYVITQDPNTPADFAKQIQRWYTGFWQCTVKHDIPWGGQMLDFEVLLLASEGLFFSLMTILYLLLSPYLLTVYPQIFFSILAIDSIFFMLPTIAYASLKNKRIHLTKDIPLFYVLRTIASTIFFWSFLQVAFSFDHRIGWNKVKRYKNID